MVIVLFGVLETLVERVPRTDPLRQDDRGLGGRVAGRGDVLDLALGRGRPLALHPDDRLPGRAGQVRSQPLAPSGHSLGEESRAGPRRPLLPAHPGARPGRGDRDRRGNVEAHPAGRGLRHDRSSRPSPGPSATSRGSRSTSVSKRSSGGSRATSSTNLTSVPEIELKTADRDERKGRPENGARGGLERHGRCARRYGCSASR